MHADDDTPYGGTGNYQNLGDAVAWLRAIAPRSVLDVGCGFGRWGFLCREFLDIWNGRVLRKDWAVRIVGVDAFASNLKEHHRLLYDEVCGERIEEFLARRSDAFDLIILGDVLEHLAKVQGYEVLRESLNRAGYVVLVLPIGEGWPQQSLYENPCERHLAVWQEADILEMRPLVARMYRDYLNRPYLGAVLSRSDPKGLRDKLAAVIPSMSSQLDAVSAHGAERPASSGSQVTMPAVVDGGGLASLHIALVTMEYPPLYGGGIATYAFQAARLLGGAGHQVSVLTQERPGEAPALPNVTVYPVPDPPGVPVRSWEFSWLAENRSRGRDFSRQLGQIHARQPIDVIEVTDYYNEGLFLDVSGLVGRKGRSVPVVTHFHGPRGLMVSLNGATRPPLLNAVEDLALAGAEFRKTYSPLMQDQVNQLWPGAACEFVPAPFSAQEPASGAGGKLPPVSYDFLYFGRLERRKGIEPFAKAIQLLVRQGHQPAVCFIGKDTETAPDEGSMANWLERELRACLGAKLHLLEARPQEELWAFLRQARVLVIPSLWESLGFVVLEGFCSCRPVICSNRAGATYILKGNLAERTLVNVHDIEAFARKLSETLAMSDEDLASWARQLGEATRAEFAPQRVLDRMVRYYRDCVATSSETGKPSAHGPGTPAWRVSLIADLVDKAVAEASEAARLSGELRELGESWQTQCRLIDEQKARIVELEQECGKLWAELRRIAKAWEKRGNIMQEQKVYIEQLERSRKEARP